MNDYELEARYPHVPWRAPLLLTFVVADEPQGMLFACRYCAARGGIPPERIVGKTQGELAYGAPPVPSPEIEGIGPFLWSSSDHQNHLDKQHRNSALVTVA